MKARRFVPNLKSEAKKEIIVKNVNDTEDIVTKESENSKISSISRLESETMERHEIVEHVPVESLPQSEDHVEVSHDMNIALTTLKEFATSPELSHQIIVNTGPSIRPSEEKTELLFGIHNDITHTGGAPSGKARRKRNRESSASSTSQSSDPTLNHEFQETSQDISAPQYVLLTRYVIRRRQGLGLRLKNVEGRAVIGGFTEEYLAHLTKSQATDLQVGDVIMAVDSADTSNPILCPFNKVVKYLQGAGDVREKPSNFQQVHLGDDPLQFTQRLTSYAKFQDTVTLRIARLIGSSFQ